MESLFQNSLKSFTEKNLVELVGELLTELPRASMVNLLGEEIRDRMNNPTNKFRLKHVPWLARELPSGKINGLGISSSSPSSLITPSFLF